MKSEQQQVKEFMQLFQRDDVRTSPGFPDRKFLLLRFRLILEELLELAAANGIEGINLYQVVLAEYTDKANRTQPNKDLLEVFDALLDLRYVVDGAIVSHGMVDIFDEGFQEVHRSNMSKRARNIDEMQNSIQAYRVIKGVEAIESKDDIYVLLDSATGKTLKPLGYSPAKLKPILDGAIQATD